MIIKNLSRKNGTGQLLRYILRYILDDAKQIKDREQFVIRHNIKSKTIPGYIQEFKSNDKNRIHNRKNQVSIYHTILSWSDKDRYQITDRMLRSMAKEYIRLRGAGSLYIGTKHEDKGHIHLHIAMSSSNVDGTTNRISKKEFADLKLSLQGFQQKRFPELSHSAPEHGKAKRIAIEQVRIKELGAIRKRVLTRDREVDKRLNKEVPSPFQEIRFRNR